MVQQTLQLLEQATERHSKVLFKRVMCLFCRAAVVRELDALMLVVEQWPRRREACLAQAAAAAAATTPRTADGTSSRRGSVTGNPASHADRSHAAATLEWLADHNNMEARIVEQLVSLRPRVMASTGSGIFSGACLHVPFVTA
jgi:trans-aconitate methyltransferase